MKITEKLLKIQHELKAPKGQYNSFGKYKYRSCEDILEAVKPLNAEQGLLLTLTDEPILIGDWHYIKATATVADGESQINVTAFARESLTKKGMDDSQITGTASSYARKYALNGLYLIDDTKDADTDEHQQTQGKKSEPQVDNKITTAQKNAIQAKTNVIAQRDSIGQGQVWENAQKALGIDKRSNELTKQEAGKFIDYLTSQEG